MSEKVTFQELIESIAGQTNNSKKFTNDFLKDFISVVNAGLEDDGKVHIAGFGKFKLRRMSERKGYNPQTGEKMTIPSHNKVVFKPYKDLRELVNAPYANLETEIFEERPGKQAEIKNESKPEEPEATDAFEKIADDIFETSGEEESEEEQELILTPPPPSINPEEDTSEHKEDEPADDKAPWENEGQDQTEEEEDPFGISATGSREELFSIDDPPGEAGQEKETGDEDIVEYKPLEENEKEPEKKEESSSVLDEYLKKTTRESDKEDGSEERAEIETEPEETGKEKPESVFSVPPEKPETAQDEGELQQHILSFSDKKSSTWTWIAAAGIVVLLVIVLGGWYFITGGWNEQQAVSLASKQQQQIAGQPQNNQPVTASEPDPLSQPPAQTATPQGSAEKPQQRKDPASLKVSEGQTLWSLAEVEYEDPYLWPWIYDANQASVSNPDLIITGQALSIPVPDLENYGLSTTDSLEVAIGYVTTYHWYKEHDNDEAKFYLWAARVYNQDVFDHIKKPIDENDLAFANRVR